MTAPRLALCGNVFPWEDIATTLAAFEQGALSALRQKLQGRLPGFGVYLPATTAQAFHADPDLRAQWCQRWRASGWPLWTANAFPYGGFHARRVKEAAFLPDWSRRERLQFTCQVADLLADLMTPGQRGSLSTCPLGYDDALRHSTAAKRHLQAAVDHLARIQADRGVSLTLALEAEPNATFERNADLAQWLQLLDLDSEHLGVCWDLCHSAVVGESTEEVLDALTATGVRCGKVQISAALRCIPDGRIPAMLEGLADDPWFHQVRGRDDQGRALAWSDLEPALGDPALVAAEELRIHCHVPVHRHDFVDGLTATPWRAAAKAALQHGIQDFEVETYTLPVLPRAMLEQEGLVGTLAAEVHACRQALGLDMTGGRA